MKPHPTEEILDRPPVIIDTDALCSEIKGKCALITGAAGSIGSEIARQIARFKPASLLLSDITESPLHLLELELKEDFPDLSFIPLISDIRNPVRMEQIFRQYRPQQIYHTAAYKHVPLMESHPSECILTNVWGTKVLADLAIRYGSDTFVMISTDKAVNPTNIMGASKRIAEMYVHSPEIPAQGEETTDTTHRPRFIITRFGNVLDSNGSVTLRFKQQIDKRAPVTVTHPDIVRYFMTVQEACQLVLEAGSIGKGGEIFIFDMGKPIKIADLAERMIRQAGLTPHTDIKIVYTGLRRGDKLYEELHAPDEHFVSTKNQRILRGESVNAKDKHDTATIHNRINKLINAATRYEDDQVVAQISLLVPEYTRQK